MSPNSSWHPRTGGSCAKNNCAIFVSIIHSRRISLKSLTKVFDISEELLKVRHNLSAMVMSLKYDIICSFSMKYFEVFLISQKIPNI